jgi:hypothetical protein
MYFTYFTWQQQQNFNFDSIGNHPKMPSQFRFLCSKDFLSIYLPKRQHNYQKLFILGKVLEI